MNGITDIIQSGRAPGFTRGATDPTHADVAVPRAMREVFDIPYRHRRNLRTQDVEKQIGFSAKTIKQTWNP